MAKVIKPSHSAYYIVMARAASTLSVCPRRKVGAVLVANKRVISTGYNGSPSGFTDCFENEGVGTCMFEGHCVNTIHAEMNALLRAREQGDELFCTDTPCINCLKAAFSHNPDIMIWYDRYYDDPARDHFIREHKLEDRVKKISEADLLDVEKIETAVFNP